MRASSSGAATELVRPKLLYRPVYAAEMTADYLDALCRYDQSAPAAPEGTDPVLYFLNESG